MSILGKIGGALGGIAKAGLGALGVGGTPKISVALPSLPQIGSGLGGSINVGSFTGGVQVGRRTTQDQSFYAQAQTSSPAAGAGCPKGYHLNKHKLAPSKRHPQGAAAHSVCVRNRHLNALNGRAAGRALRRLKRADKMTRKIHRLFHRPTHAKKVGKR